MGGDRRRAGWGRTSIVLLPEVGVMVRGAVVFEVAMVLQLGSVVFVVVNAGERDP